MTTLSHRVGPSRPDLWSCDGCMVIGFMGLGLRDYKGLGCRVIEFRVQGGIQTTGLRLGSVP